MIHFDFSQISSIVINILIEKMVWNQKIQMTIGIGWQKVRVKNMPNLWKSLCVPIKFLPLSENIVLHNTMNYESMQII